MQLLDETVALARMSLGWNRRVALVRIYRFDYSKDGADRAAGLVVVQRGAVVHVQLADRDAALISRADLRFPSEPRADYYNPPQYEACA